jgi:hypothetical protein
LLLLLPLSAAAVSLLFPASPTPAVPLLPSPPLLLLPPIKLLPTSQPASTSCSCSSLSSDLKGPEQEGQGMPLARSGSCVHLGANIQHDPAHSKA